MAWPALPTMIDWPKEDRNEKEKKEMGADSINDDSRLQETKK